MSAARLREAGLRALRRAGWAGGLGAALLAVALLIAVVGGGAIDGRREALEAERTLLARRAPAEAATASGAPSPTERLATFHAGFPPLRELPRALARLHAHAGRYGLDLPRADYQSTEQVGTPLQRVSLNLPVHGEFGQIYRWLGELLADMPEVALEAVTVRREDSALGVVDAEVRLALFMRRAP